MDREVAKGSSEALVTVHTATYDPVGNRVGVQETINTEGSFGLTYTYDQANQLLSEQRYGLSPYSNTFTYDPAGNQLSVTPASGVITTNTYNSANALTLTTPGTGQPTTLTYDPAGNRLTQNAAGTLTTFTWDYENRNTLLVSPTGVPLTNTYDATGIRRNDGTSAYVWDGLNVLQTRNPASGNAKVSQFTNFPGYWGGLTSQYNVATTSSLFYAFDQIGNTRLVSTPTGTVNSTFDYTAFGTEYHVTGGTGILFRFNGKWGLVRPSSVAWLLYAMQRWVDVMRAQWVSRDLIGFPGGWNLYEFVRNNPERWVDPSGTVIAASSGLIAELPGSTLSGTVIGFQAPPGTPASSMGAAALSGSKTNPALSAKVYKSHGCIKIFGQCFGVGCHGDPDCPPVSPLKPSPPRKHPPFFPPIWCKPKPPSPPTMPPIPVSYSGCMTKCLALYPENPYTWCEKICSAAGADCDEFEDYCYGLPDDGENDECMSVYWAICQDEGPL